jgi:hypothetical protein
MNPSKKILSKSWCTDRKELLKIKLSKVTWNIDGDSTSHSGITLREQQ